MTTSLIVETTNLIGQPTTSAIPNYIYIYDYYGNSYDDVSLTTATDWWSGSTYGYGYDDQGDTIYHYGSNYVYDANESSYFYYDNTRNAYLDYTTNTPTPTIPNSIRIYDYYGNSYDDVSLTTAIDWSTGSQYGYGYDDQGDTIYHYGSNYVYDARESSYFYYDNTRNAYIDYTANTPTSSIPNAIRIYDYYASHYDDVSLTTATDWSTGSQYGYGYDDQGDTIYHYGSNYVYDAREQAYFNYDNSLNAYIDYTVNWS